MEGCSKLARANRVGTFVRRTSRADAGHTTSDSRLDTVEPPIKDEAVTNAAVTAYLDTTADLRLIEAANNSQWVHNHMDMGARFHSRPERRYVAKVDGVL